MKWEYLTADASELTDAELDAFGYSGWELVCVLPANERRHERACFKRPLQETAP